jgi:drug/metabolite transporter (DMT)-like permease
MTYPLIYPFFGYFILKESYTKIDFIFALLGFAGTLILIKPGFIFGN